MKQVSQFYISVGLVVALSGCGSSHPPSIAIGCTTRALSSQLVQARVTVRNTTNLTRKAVLYGPALLQVHYVHPTLQTVDVVVTVSHRAQSYPGWVIPRVSPQNPVHVLFQVATPAQPQSILVSTGTSVRLGSQQDLNNDACTVGTAK